jgi:hypothetical protein
MITIQVIDQSGASGPYRMTGRSALRLQDNVKCIRWEGGLALIEAGRKHTFNKAGEYTGTEAL